MNLKAISLTLCAIFTFSNVALASKYEADCLNKSGKFSSCKVTVQNETIRLDYGDNDLDTLIYGNQVKSLSSGEYARRRIGEAVGTAIFTFGIGALVAFSKKKRDQIGIEYTDGEISKGTMIQIKKKYGLALKQELKAASGQAIQESK